MIYQLIISCDSKSSHNQLIYYGNRLVNLKKFLRQRHKLLLNLLDIPKAL